MMREVFLERPTPQTNAKLLFGKTQVACFIVEVTTDGFRVAVPGVDQYEGDPKLTLVTSSAVYPVRLVLQEAHTGGYSYRLQRSDEVSPPKSESNVKFRWSFLTSNCCAAGVISLIVSGCFCIIPNSNDRTTLLGRRGLRYESLGAWSPSIVENDRVPPGISVDSSLAMNDIANEDDEDYGCDMQTISVSMVTPASMSVEAPSRLAHHELTWGNFRHGGHGQQNPAAKTKQDVSLKVLLEEGQVGGIQTASPALVSWLFGSTQSSERHALRMSDAARRDLNQFQIGLKVLPDRLSSQAVASLRRTLSLADADHNSAQVVPGIRDVFVITSDDANIYFRKIHGQIELVRVLPIDLNKAERQ